MYGTTGKYYPIPEHYDFRGHYAWSMGMLLTLHK